MIKSTFLGHQSWHFETSSGMRILADPVLGDSYGSGPSPRFWIHPPRAIDLETAGDADALVLTNEHLDHFDPRSLSSINRDAKVILGPLAPDWMLESVKSLGFSNVRRAPSAEPVVIEGVAIRLLASRQPEPVWELRSHSLVIEDTDGDAVYLQGDRSLPRDRTEYGLPDPRVAIVTNNSQFRHDDNGSTFGNILNPPTGNFTGLKIARDVIGRIADVWSNVECVLLSGNGYTLNRGSSRFLFTSPEELNPALATLSPSTMLAVLSPGQCLDGQALSDVPWISPVDYASIGPAEQDPHQFREVDTSAIVDSLNFFVPHIIASDFGTALVRANEHLGTACGPQRFFIGLISGEAVDSVVFDINKSTFEQSELAPDVALERIPFGVVLDGSLLQAALAGDVQIWEAATYGSQQWYPGDPMLSPLAALFGMLSSSVRPDLWARNTLVRFST